MKDNIICPVIVEELKDAYILTFPTFDYMVSDTGKDEDYIKAAQEIIALHVLDAEEEKRELPAFDDNKIKLTKKQKLIYVNVWMPYHRTMVKTVYIRKNVTIPVWLDELAKASGINFSETLTEALKKKLSLYANS